MEIKVGTPESEKLLRLYNDTHEHKIKMEHVEEMSILDNKLEIIWGEYDDDGSFLGYFGYTMDIPSAE